MKFWKITVEELEKFLRDEGVELPFHNDELLQKLEEGLISGLLVFESVEEIIEYFDDWFQETYGVSDQVMYYVDIEEFIDDLIIAGDIVLIKLKDYDKYIVAFCNVLEVVDDE